MDIRFKVGVHELTATLLDNATARDFYELLPMTLDASDLLKREKFAHLPRALTTATKASRSFEVGDIVYWPPSQDLAIFYRDDGGKIPAPGIIKIGRMDEGVESFAVPGSVALAIEPMSN